MNSILLEFDISNSDPAAALGVRVELDGVEVYHNSHQKDTYHFSHEISDEDGDHELVIEILGKLPEHTEITESGEIVKDALINITNIMLDAIDIGTVFQDLAVYHHDFNGSQSPVEDRFYSSLGCNGQVRMAFSTPVYLWLLQNL